MAKQIIDVPQLIDSSKFGFSHCIKSGDVVFVAGQCGHGPDGPIPDDFRQQCFYVFEALKAAVEAAGGTLSDIVSMNVFITKHEYYPIFTEVRAGYFPKDYPTSAAVGVVFLVPPKAMVEIQAIAVLD